MKRILLPTDFSKNSWQAIQFAITLFKDEKCGFFVLNTIEPPASAPSTAVTSKKATKTIYEAMKRETEAGLRKMMTKIRKLPKNEGHIFETMVVHDYFVAGVITAIEAHDIDIVVLGTKGASGLKGVTMGSNTSGLVGKLRCPIIAVPENCPLDELDEIGFATDFSIMDYGNNLEILKDLAKAHGSDILVVHVMNKGKELTPKMRASKKALEKALRPNDIDFYYLTDVPIEIGTRIFSESRELDMMCVIAKKHGFFERLFQKSQSKAISHNAKVPLLIFNENSFD